MAITHIYYHGVGNAVGGVGLVAIPVAAAMILAGTGIEATAYKVSETVEGVPSGDKIAQSFTDDTVELTHAEYVIKEDIEYYCSKNHSHVSHEDVGIEYDTDKYWAFIEYTTNVETPVWDCYRNLRWDNKEDYTYTWKF